MVRPPAAMQLPVAGAVNPDHAGEVVVVAAEDAAAMTYDAPIERRLAPECRVERWYVGHELNLREEVAHLLAQRWRELCWKSHGRGCHGPGLSRRSDSFCGRFGASA